MNVNNKKRMKVYSQLVVLDGGVGSYATQLNDGWMSRLSGFAFFLGRKREGQQASYF